VLKGQWAVLPARLLKDVWELRLSPLGASPQRGRRPRTICDYAFYGVNNEMIAQAPADAMQFGKALLRVLQHTHLANPHLGPVCLSKIDISDGFYHIWVQAEDIPKLGVILPTREHEEPLVGLPLTLPMGWRESPPWFSSATETVADLANDTLSRSGPQLAHRLEDVSETPAPIEPDATTPQNQRAAASKVPPSRQTNFRQKPIAYWDVYVDDFVGLVQGNQ